MDQIHDAIDIFEYLHPDKVGVWVFDCSSAHEGLAADALNVNNMNVNPGGKQKHLRSTTIPLDNPAPNLDAPIHVVCNKIWFILTITPLPNYVASQRV